MDMQTSPRARVGVVGGSGYTGLELLRRLASHPGVETVFALSRAEAGQPTPVPGLVFTAATPEEITPVDFLFLCLPHGATEPWIEAGLASGARVIDLTSDNRPGSGTTREAAFGLAEWEAESVAGASLVANPGCYPTGVLTSVRPLHQANALGNGVISVQAASGVTGAGRSPRRDLLFGEITGSFKAYGLGNTHRHLREMRWGLPGRNLLFVPHLLPVERGILETIVVPVAPDIDAEAVKSIWKARYAGSPVIRVVDEAPSLRDVTRSDLLLMSAFDNDELPGLITLIVALDNLGKGAAGQAIQNLNLMAGMPAEWGLQCAPS